ncbi:hypothetical protein DMC01_02095 [Campylobacter troglodytis]|nr:hypothetical protein DMC01_02095 [Campylobacter troglodytis]
MLYNARIPPKYYDIFYQMLAENMGGGGGSPSENVGSLSQRGSPSQNAEFFQNNNAFETCSTSQAKQQLSENEPFKNGELASLEPSYNNEVSKARSSLQIQEDKAPIVIDCGAHAGLVSDLCLHCGATVYAFEPNIYLQYFLKRKFEGKKARLYQKAVGVKNYKTSFKVFQGRILSQGNRVVSSVQDKETSQSYEVEVIDLCEFIEKEFITQKKQIYLLKLDIEGAEFEILEKLITKKLYKHIKFIACETHEYMFKDGKARLEKLKAQISKAKITNILLDWC